MNITESEPSMDGKITYTDRDGKIVAVYDSNTQVATLREPTGTTSSATWEEHLTLLGLRLRLADLGFPVANRPEVIRLPSADLTAGFMNGVADAVVGERVHLTKITGPLGESWRMRKGPYGGPTEFFHGDTHRAYGWGWVVHVSTKADELGQHETWVELE